MKTTITEISPDGTFKTVATYINKFSAVRNLETWLIQRRKADVFCLDERKKAHERISIGKTGKTCYHQYGAWFYTAIAHSKTGRIMSVTTGRKSCKFDYWRKNIPFMNKAKA